MLRQLANCCLVACLAVVSTTASEAQTRSSTGDAEAATARSQNQAVRKDQKPEKEQLGKQPETRHAANARVSLSDEQPQTRPADIARVCVGDEQPEKRRAADARVSLHDERPQIRHAATARVCVSDGDPAHHPLASRVRMNDADSASVPVQRKLTKEDGGVPPPTRAAGPDDGLCAVPADPGLLPFRDGLYGDPCGRGGVFVDGWLAQGFTANFDGPANNFNLPVTFNDRANEYQLNQLYVTAGRRTDPELGHGQLGGRIDLLYGTDYFFTTALGLETHQDGSPKWNSADGPRGAGAALYGLAMPQVYAEVFAPVGNGLTVKLGHFYTILGVESVMAPANFFYSRAYAKQYGEPFTHTALLADYRLSPAWTVQAAFTRGWNNWEDNNDRLGFLGGADWTSPDERTTVAFALHTGSEDAAGEYNRTVYSLVVERKITCRLSYIFQHDFGVEDGAQIARDGSRDSAQWYGINQYLIYRAGEEVDLGLRLEWFRDQDNARVLGIPIEPLVGGGNYFALTAGMNWKPRSWVNVRPEIRWDHSDVEAPDLGIGGMFDDRTKKDQLTAAVDVVLVY